MFSGNILTLKLFGYPKTRKILDKEELLVESITSFVFQRENWKHL